MRLLAHVQYLKRDQTLQILLFQNEGTYVKGAPCICKCYLHNEVFELCFVLETGDAFLA